MANEPIGIAGAIVVTLLLFGLRRLVLPSERASKSPQVRNVRETEHVPRSEFKP